jgi:hypothetical protein
MREILDSIMMVLFVLFMIFMVRGFMLQSQEKNRHNKKDK